jgi:hypothetical protein
MNTHSPVVASFLFLGAHAVGQCALQPAPTGSGTPSVDGPVHASTTWDPDGPGPAPARLVVAGNFTLAGTQPAPGLAAFDPTTNAWSSLGALPSYVAGLATLPNGSLFAFGQFVTSPTTADWVKQWSGSAWVGVAPAVSSYGVSAVAMSPLGEPWLCTMLSPAAAGVCRFTGGIWQLVGTPAHLGASEIRTIAFAPNGDVWVGGVFTTMNGVLADSLARWDGTAWSAVGQGVSGRVLAIAFAANGDAVVGGQFLAAGGTPANNVARWNGTSWSPLGGGTSHPYPPAGKVRSLAIAPNGDVIAGGEFTSAGGAPASLVARWNGASWSAMGTGIDLVPLTGDPSVASVQHLGGEVFACGNFARAGGRDATGLARWNGTTWAPAVASGIGRGAVTVHRAPNGDVFLGGAFRDIDGVPCNGIARRVGSTWQPLGSGLASNTLHAGVATMASDRNGDLVVGGWFSTAGGVAAQNIARWNGASWQPLGSGLTGPAGSPPTVHAMTTAPNGAVWVVGTFHAAGGVAVESVASWDGTAWSTLPPGLSQGATGFAALQAVAVGSYGDVFVAGEFDLGGPAAAKVARWNGVAWQVIARLDGQVRTLVALPDGELLAGGGFTTVDTLPLPALALLSNGGWSAVGSLATPATSSDVDCVVRLPGGDLVAAGWLDLGAQATGLARWNGSAWTPLADAPVQVLDLAVDPAGELLLAGSFSSLGTSASAAFARYTTPCAATVVAAGAGCVGSGGANVLAVVSPPWLGATFVSRASGMPANGLALSVIGLGTASVPLAAILPQGGAGCSLLVTPDLLSAGVIPGSTLELTLLLPSTPALVGAVLHQQVVPLELAASGAIVALTSTNRLTLTLGAF